MSESGTSKFVYVTYIRTTPEKLWAALTEPEFTKKYWLGAHVVSDFKAGSAWKLEFDDGRLADSGEILESDPPRRLVIKWLNQWSPEINAEGYSRCTMTLEAADSAVKLTVEHAIDKPKAKLIDAVSGGWPKILSNLKSLLETGALAIETRKSGK
jgi:uncharacterized protein YndB with AHSA1/START domain